MPLTTFDKFNFTQIKVKQIKPAHAKLESRQVKTEKALVESRQISRIKSLTIFNAQFVEHNSARKEVRLKSLHGGGGISRNVYLTEYTRCIKLLKFLIKWSIYFCNRSHVFVATYSIRE